MPLAVTEDTPPDMLAGAMDITVVLPSGRSVNMSVDRSTPMMDLLVQLTTTHKLSLAGHMTVALSESGARLHHLPSTPIGALDTRLLHVAPRNNTTLKRAPLRPNNVQPFQTTFRLQVHLPRNQLFVTRVSPDTCLADILHLACAEKNLDPAKYELRHPANLQDRLSLSHTLDDYHLQEVTLVAARPMGSPLTPADIMALQKEEEKRRQQVKATGSAYIMYNKRGNTNVHPGTGSVSSDSLNGRSISPARSDESANRSVSPPAPLLPPQRPGRKRRPAPKPPASSVKDESITNHSRTSSDSSGYHEASVLSESMETRTGEVSADTLPRRSKLPSTNPTAAKQKATTLQHGASNNTNHVNLSRSLSNLTSQGISGLHSASTTSLASQGNRKKKAAPPPPVAPARRQAPPAINGSQSAVNVPSTPSGINTSKTTLVNVNPSATIVVSVRPEPVPEEQSPIIVHKTIAKTPEPVKETPKPVVIPVKETPKPVVIPVKETPKPDVIPVKETPKPVEIPVKETPKPVLIPVLEVPKPIVVVDSKPDTLSSRDIEKKPATEQKPAVVSPVPVAKASFTPVPTSQSADVESDDISERERCPSSEVSEWEYQLPDPPSAFRDLESPTLTEFGTVALADTPVFQEQQIEQRRSSLERATVGSKSSCSNDFDDSWEPQKLGVEEIAQRPRFINSDLRLREDGVTKEIFKVNPIFNAEQFEEESVARKIPAKYAPAESEIIEKSKNLVSRNISNDLQTSNQLRNFTISAYEKSQTSTEFKKPLPPKPATLTRTNSYTSNDVPRPVVKRSTSYIALARPYSRPSTFQSINRTKSISSLVEEDSSSGEMRKANSEVNVSRVADEEPMLASLIVLKSILNQSQATINKESTNQEEALANVLEVNSSAASDSFIEPHQPIAVEKTSNGNEPDRVNKSSDNYEPEPVKEEEVKPKPFVYLGPPAINFGSWSERPKVQVSIKSDRDYRFGGQVSNENPANANTTTPINRFKNAVLRNSVPSDYTMVEAKPAKIEPTPLTMRIISHTAARSDVSQDIVTSRSVREPLVRSESDEVDHSSRLPIVRSVELKKTFPDNFVQLRNKSSTHLNGGSNNISQVSVNNYHSNISNRHSCDAGILLKKSVSSGQLNDAASKRYTSVVGINGGGVNSLQRPMINTKPDLNARANVFSAPKPMPTVKGFRSAGGDGSSFAPLKEEQATKPIAVVDIKPLSYANNKPTEYETFRGQPLKTINGAENARTQPSWAQRNDKFSNAYSEPAQVIKFKKPVQRPIEKKHTNPRDALMDAIKNFGGEDGLKVKNESSNGSG